jgi:hypothetical protein
MWQRTKRLINSYLDNLVERLSNPDSGVREVTRAEVARLGELEVQARASAKMLEKELAEIELKIAGLFERERILKERGDLTGAAAAGRDLRGLAEQVVLLRQQLSEANASAARAKKLREERRLMGQELAAETHLTEMRENIAGIQTPFDATDPAATIDEMRSRIRPIGFHSIDDRVAEADREMESLQRSSRVDDILAQYKQRLSESDRPAPPAPSATPDPKPGGEEAPGGEKTLGRASDGVKPID